MRLRIPLVSLAAVVGLAAVAVDAPAASATSASSIAALALANVGKKACSVNSRGGRFYGSSCTGNGGKPEFWCADFAKWVWQQEAVGDTWWLTPAAGSFYTYGLTFGTLSAYPAVGDVAVFNYYGGGVANHVAVVTQVNRDGTVETVSGDWGGHGNTEAGFSSTSKVVKNSPSYNGSTGTASPTMGMTISGYVAPVGVAVSPVVGWSALQAGSSLAKGQSLVSPNGQFRLDMQADGNLVEYVGKRPIWDAGTDARGGSRVLMQGDGNLVVYNSEGQAVWATGTGGHAGGGLYLALSNAGRLSVTAGGGALWARQPGTSSVTSGTTLSAGDKLVSNDGLYDLVMQSDGNLVEYTAGRPIWSTRTSGHAGAKAVVQKDSNLVIYSETGRVLWAATGGGRSGSFRLVLQNDGSMAIYGPTSTIWHKAPGRG